MVRIVDRYLLKEVVVNWLATTLLLWLIVLGNRLANYLAQAAAGDIPGYAVFTLLGLKSVTYLDALLPFSLYLGVLLALGRLYKDSEMAALAACGVGPAQLYRPLLLLGVSVTVALSWLSLVVVPHANAAAYRIEASAKQSTSLALVAPGRFQEARGGDLIYYVEKVSHDRRQMTDIFAEDRQDGRLGIISAARGYQRIDPKTGDRYLVLEDGYRYEGFPGDPGYRVMRFQSQGMLIEPAQPVVRMDLDALPTAQLWHGTLPTEIAELQWRLSIPLAALVLIVLAVPLSRTTPRQGRYGRLFAAVLVFIIYYNLLGSARVWVQHGNLPPAIGMWWVHGLALAVAGVLLSGRNLLPPRRRSAS
ncbi:MAG: LPS export ABC transporter permease LptF [Gammaproteobacteria bacterium]